jgi:cell division protein FtsW (lipid II flippase)
MRFFWLSMAVLSFALVTVMGFKNGFDRWIYYYVFSFVALGMYFFKSWMMKRMERHLEYLSNQNKENESVGK